MHCNHYFKLILSDVQRIFFKHEVFSTGKIVIFVSGQYLSSRPRGVYDNLRAKMTFPQLLPMHLYDQNVFLKRPGTASRVSNV